MKSAIIALLFAVTLCSRGNFVSSAGFTCPDFANKTVTQCSNYTSANIYYTDIAGIWYVQGVTFTPPEKCDYAEFQPATGDACMSKLFGYTWYTSVDKATSQTFSGRLNWITTGLGRVNSINDGGSSTGASVIIVHNSDGFVLIRCSLSGGTSSPPVGFLLTKERNADKKIISGLKIKAQQAGYNIAFQSIDQKNCPAAISHNGPIVTIT